MSDYLYIHFLLLAAQVYVTAKLFDNLKSFAARRYSLTALTKECVNHQFNIWHLKARIHQLGGE